uniref:Chemokine interleukin-8-like domain-containing protein n=1 Tax=Denticeps clupeoides TaxID=299321 RepID=A0AAY4AF47_9TELE
ILLQNIFLKHLSDIFIKHCIAESQEKAKPTCCTAVSHKEINGTILSFTFREGKPPCVKAVV